MSYLLLVTVFLCACHLLPSSGQQSEVCETLYLLNIVPFPDNRTFAGWDKGFELIPAGHIATRHINNNSDILQGYQLEVIDVASEACGKSIITEGLLEFYQLILDPMRTCIFGVVGLYCSTVTNIIAPIANHRRIGYVQLAASTSPLHRDITLLPHTFHTIASSSVFNEAMIALMNDFKWTKIHIVHDSLGFYFMSTANDFVQLINSDSNKTLVSRLPILPQRRLISDVFDIINQEEARIGYFSVTEGESASLFCEAYKRQFLWPGYAYILHERSLPQILMTEVDCTQEEMVRALEGVFLLQYRLSSPEESKLVSGLTYEQYHDEYIQELSKFAREKRMVLEDNLYANTLYDQVWAYALAANKSLDTINFLNSSVTTSSVRESVRIREVLTTKLKEVSFIGASGYFEFGEKREIQTFVDVYQVQNGEQVILGTYNSLNKSILFLSNFDRSVVPGDTFDLQYQLVPIWMGGLVIVLDILLISLIVFNTVSLIYWRKRPEIKSGSYYLSWVILAGCYMLCLSPVLQTVHEIFIVTNPALLTVTCNLEFWFFLNGTNIIFVTLLVRLFRIYYVFRSYHSTGKYWSDKYLLFYILVISSVMVVLMLIWMTVDPVRFITENTYDSNAIPPHYAVKSYCSSKSLGVWLALSLSLIGLVMMSVIFLAIQTRHIKRKHFKDTKKVNILIFSVSITCAIFIPLLVILFTAGYETGAYICRCIVTLAVAALCQIFLFLPKILPNFYYKWKPEPLASKDTTSTVYIKKT